MTASSYTRAVEDLCQRFYPAVWVHAHEVPLAREWLRTLSELSARERLVLVRLEKQLQKEERTTG